MKPKEVKTVCNLVESSKEGYGSKWSVLPTMMITYTTVTKNMNQFFVILEKQISQ
jgi:hypothetical protein